MKCKEQKKLRLQLVEKRAEKEHQRHMQNIPDVPLEADDNTSVDNNGSESADELNEYIEISSKRRKMDEIDVREQVRQLLKEKLGSVSSFVFQYIPDYQQKQKKNNMPLTNTAKASLRCNLTPHDTALICSEFLKDLIAAGHLS